MVVNAQCLFIGGSVLLNLTLMSYVVVNFQPYTYLSIENTTNNRQREIKNYYEDDEPISLVVDSPGVKKEKVTTKKPLDVLGNLKHVLNCSEKRLDPYISQRGIYKVYNNYIQAKFRYKCYESVTLSTHGEFGFLDNLIFLVDRWKGPVSVSVFTAKDDYETSVKTVLYLKNCRKSLISDYVSFHFIFQEKHFPETIVKPHLLESTFNVSCSEKEPWLSVNTSYRNANKVLYPVNVARNVAKYEANTYFVLPSDIELYPNPNVIPRFLKMIARDHKLVSTDPPKVFVLPIFEVSAKYQAPSSKKELVELYRKKDVVVFHKYTCPQCQRLPELEKWLKTSEDVEEQQVTAVAKRTGKYSSWEPIFIGTSAEPPYDERLSWEGKKDKMTQMYALCAMGYEFHVLNSAFLVHRPGIKNGKMQKDENKWRSPIVNKQNKFVANSVKAELKAMYGHNKACTL